MGKRRRVRTSRAPKVNASQEEKSTKRQEKSCKKETGVGSRETTASSAKKQKLEPSQTESEVQLEKYVPPFTASQRVVKIGRDKLSLNKTGGNSQEKSAPLKNAAGKESMKDDRYDNIPEGNDGEVVSKSKNWLQQTVDDPVDRDAMERNAIPDEVSQNIGEDEGQGGVETNKEMKDIPGISLGNLELSTIPTNGHVLESDQTIIHGKESSNDDKTEDDKSQRTNDLKPKNTGDGVCLVVPKLSDLIKKYYINVEADEKIAEKPIATEDTRKSSVSVKPASSKDTELGNAEGVKSEKKSTDVIDGKCLSKSNTTSTRNMEICSQLNSSNIPNKVTSFETDCSTELTEVEKLENTQKLHPGLSENDVHDNRSQQPSVPTTDYKEIDEQNDQEVPDETSKECPVSKPNSITEEQPALSPGQAKAISSPSDENNLDKQNDNDTSAPTSVADTAFEPQSFAKEFEALEELLPKDDMGMFDDVIDCQLKSASDEREISEGDSTMEFLINELSCLNCMVMNYQRAVEEMKRHHNFSGRH